MERQKNKRGKRKKKKGFGIKLIFFLLILSSAVVFFFFFFLGRLQLSKESERASLKKWPPKSMEKEVSLFFCDPENPILVRELRKIDKTLPLEAQAKEVINALISGPKSGLSPTIPQKTKLRGISIDPYGTATVDFSKEIATSHPGGSSGEIITIYSIVNSLAMNFNQVKRVQILVEGKKMETLAGHIFIKEPIEPDEGLIRS
jgi:hypothetical protein